MAVKKNIEDVQGKDNYPWGQQLLIHNGKVLKDESTLEENKVGEDGFLVVMLSKVRYCILSSLGYIKPNFYYVILLYVSFLRLNISYCSAERNKKYQTFVKSEKNIRQPSSLLFIFI